MYNYTCIIRCMLYHYYLTIVGTYTTKSSAHQESICPIKTNDGNKIQTLNKQLLLLLLLINRWMLN